MPISSKAFRDLEPQASRSARPPLWYALRSLAPNADSNAARRAGAMKLGYLRPPGAPDLMPCLISLCIIQPVDFNALRIQSGLVSAMKFRYGVAVSVIVIGSLLITVSPPSRYGRFPNNTSYRRSWKCDQRTISRH